MDQNYRQGCNSSGFGNSFLARQHEQVNSGQCDLEAAPFQTPLLQRKRELLLPDVLQGKAEMNGRRVDPQNRGEIQQRLKHDFLRKSRSQLLKTGKVWWKRVTL